MQRGRAVSWGRDDDLAAESLVMSTSKSRPGESSSHRSSESGPLPESERSHQEPSLDFPSMDSLDFDSILAGSKQRKRHLLEVESLKRNLSDDRSRDYLAEFDDAVADEVLHIGYVDRTAAQLEEKRLRELRRQVIEFEERMHLRNLRLIKQAENRALKQIDEDLKTKLANRSKRENARVEAHARRLKRLSAAFAESKRQLRAVLRERQKEVARAFGSLVDADEFYGGSDGKRQKINWSKRPQPIRLDLFLLRGVKDKFPRGRYVVLVNIFERMGGMRIPWSQTRAYRSQEIFLGQSRDEDAGQQVPGNDDTKNARMSSFGVGCALHKQIEPSCEMCTGWVAGTRSIDYAGDYNQIEMFINESVSTLCPSKFNMRPYMVFIFEIVHMRGDHSPFNRVVGWGAFPICDPKFDVVRGKHKTPILRGPYDPTIDNYEKLDFTLRQDLENWIGNLYFEIKHLPRTTKDQNEFELEVSFTSQLLHLDAEKRLAKAIDRHSDWGDDSDSEGSSSVSDSDDDSNEFDFGIETSRSTSSLQLREEAQLIQGGELQDRSGESELSESMYGEMRRVAPGLTYYVHGNEKIDDSNFLQQSDILDEAGAYRRRLNIHRKEETLAQKLEKYRYSIRQPQTYRGRKEASQKMGYIWRAVISDLSLSRPSSLEFWGMILIFIVVFWMRMHIHYFGIYIFLQSMGISVVNFSPSFFTVMIEYQWQLLPIEISIGVVLFGPLFNLMALAFGIVFAWLSQSLFGTFLDWGSRFVIAFGFFVVLDPIAVLVVDVAMWNFEFGDAFKLYNHFFFEEGNGILGIFLTIFFYASHIFVALFLLYNYILRIHMNGLMYDVYVRLHGEESTFFVPGDLEVSVRELKYIVDQAERWRGQFGERRKTVVSEFILTDDNDPDWSETTTQLTIWTLRKNGQPTPFRKFIRLSSGTISEIFDEGSMSSSEYTKFARFISAKPAAPLGT